MIPQIFVTPVSLSGLNDATVSPASTGSYYPLVGFTAYATGISGSTGSATPPACNNAGTAPSCSGGPAGSNYWRVCLDIATTAGASTNATAPNNNWNKYGVLLAITRCAPPSEPSGSDFTVWTQ